MTTIRNNKQKKSTLNKITFFLSDMPVWFLTPSKAKIENRNTEIILNVLNIKNDAFCFHRAAHH